MMMPTQGTYESAGGAKRGLKWISGGFSLFMKQPGRFAIVGLALYAVAAVLSGLGAIGSGIATMAGVLAAGSLVRACQAMEHGTDPVLAARNAVRAAPLFMLGLLAAGLGIGLALLGSVMPRGMLILVTIPLMMGLWLAPGLVVIKGATPLQALRLSLIAALSNIVPFMTLYLLASIAIFIGGKLQGCGLIFVYPMVMCTSYMAYRDIVEARPTPPPV